MANKTATKTAHSSATRTGAYSRRSRGNKRRNGNERKMFAIIILLAVALVGAIGVAVAAFSTDLYINGSATVASSVWDVHFANLQSVSLAGTYAEEVTNPTIQTSANGVPMTAIQNYNVKLRGPGDSATYTFDVVNAGDMDARIASVQINTGANLTCTSDAGTEVANRVCAKLNYTLVYSDGTAVAAGDTLPHGNNNTKTMKLKLELDPSTTTDELPNKAVNVDGLAVVIHYEQDI